MARRLEGKNAVVTGAGRGIGRAIALALAAEGAKVVVNDPGVALDGSGGSNIPAEEVAKLIRGRGGVAVANYESVADYSASKRIIDSCVDGFGSIDILVNVAGILRDGMIWELTEDDWDAVLDVHLKGTFNCTRHACALMKEQKSGRIINTTSGAWLGITRQVNYVAAKAGIVSLSRAVAMEMAEYGVTCNLIAPIAGTRMLLDEQTKAGLYARYVAGQISREMLDDILNMPGPEFIPPIVLYLATDNAANISGWVFGCNAGEITIYSQPQPMRGIYKDHKKLGPWTLDELMDLVPRTLGANLPPLTPPR